MGHLTDKISSSSNIHSVFHWFRKVLVSELSTNGIAVYLFTNQPYKCFKMADAIQNLDFSVSSKLLGADKFDDFQLS